MESDFTTRRARSVTTASGSRMEALLISNTVTYRVCAANQPFSGLVHANIDTFENTESSVCSAVRNKTLCVVLLVGYDTGDLQHVLECFISLIPQQRGKNSTILFIKHKMHPFLSVNSYI